MNAITAKKKITVLVPCYNEEEGIGKVIEGFSQISDKASEYEIEIIVIDNNSADKTAQVARFHGATVIHEPKQGKGHAIRTGFYSIPADSDYVLMLDGDNTYKPAEALRLVELLNSGFCNVAIGSRLGGRISEGSMTTFNRAGNWIFSHLVRYVYRVNVTDVLTGYFAWKLEAVERLRPHLVSNGFAIEMEMITKMARLGENIYCVPITYDARAGNSNLHPIRDGFRILFMFLNNLDWKPKAQKKKRIAFVSDAVMPYNLGGKERRLYEISKRLVNESCEVHIYTMKWWDGPRVIESEGVYFHAISKLYPLYQKERRSMLQAVLFGLATLKLIFEEFDVLDVDHMPFFPLFSARVVTWCKGKKLHATWHEVWGQDYWREYLKGMSSIFGNFTEQLSFAMPDVIISNSEHTAGRLREVGFKGEIKTVPLGVDLESICASQPSEDKSDIIFVGRLLSHKNADVLIRAVAIVKKTIPTISCNIIGSGPEKTKLLELIEKLNLKDNIKILENVEKHSELYGSMKASKMLVLPSNREGFGLVAIEANAAGLPVITTSHENNAAKDLIYEGVNGLVAKLNEENIAEKILFIMQSQDKMNPKQGIEKYDWNEVVKCIRESFAIM